MTGEVTGSVARFVADLVTLSPTPPPYRTFLLQTNGKQQFDKPVTRLSKLLFRFVLTSIQHLFFLSPKHRFLLFDKHRQ